MRERIKVFQDSHTCHEVLTDFVLEISLFTKHGRSEVFNSYHASLWEIRWGLLIKQTLKLSATTHHVTGFVAEQHLGDFWKRKEKRTSCSQGCQHRIIKPFEKFTVLDNLEFLPGSGEERAFQSISWEEAFVLHQSSPLPSSIFVGTEARRETFVTEKNAWLGLRGTH